MPPRALQPPILPFLRPPRPIHFLLTPLTPSRTAAHATETRANGAKAGPGKRLGAKRGASELVVPGCIIFRQRGTLWFPGENCGMGRDHTIFAREKGYVTYYRDEERYPGRKYIGIVFERGQTLPRGRNEARRRRLGLESKPRLVPYIPPPPPPTTTNNTTPPEGSEGDSAQPTPSSPTTTRKKAAGAQLPKRETIPVPEVPKGKKGYMFRESNWTIGRAAERASANERPRTRRERAQRFAEREEAKKAELLLNVGRRKGKKGKGGKKGRGRR